MKLDETDKKILNILLNDARKRSQDIAIECGLSGAAVHHRLQKIKKTNIVKGTHLSIDPATLGYSTCAFVNLRISIESPLLYEELFTKLKAIPEVVECHHITGKYSLIIKVYSKSNSELKNLIIEKIQSIPEIIGTETFLSLGESFERLLPID